MSKADFPIFTAQPNLVYLDSAATTLLPGVVADAVRQAGLQRGPVGRSLYPLGVEATASYSTARAKIAAFIGAPTATSHVIFTAGATDSLNRLAQGISDTLKPGDQIILSEAEHHANLLPWQALSHSTGARLSFVRHNQEGNLDLNQLGELLTPATKVVSLSLVSNVLGTILPTAEITALLNRFEEQQGSRPWFFLDASQAIAHLPLSVSSLGADAIVFSGHKLYGPSGIGILWGTTKLLESLTPTRLGGGMVVRTTLTDSSFGPLPERLEAGSPNLESAAGLAAAITYLEGKGIPQVTLHTEEQARTLRSTITKTGAFHVIGNPNPQSGLISFTHATIHPHDIAQVLADNQICVRAGHQCAQPLHTSLNLQGSVRVSVGLYTDTADIQAFALGLQKVLSTFHE